MEIYSRVTGYHQPISKWNLGKKEEFKERKPYDLGKIKVAKGGIVQ